MIDPFREINNAFKICFEQSDTFVFAEKTSDIGDEVAHTIRVDIPTILSNILANNDYIVKGSIGVGRATKSPWIAILDKNITTTTREGVYIVFLFSSDYKHVYLTLNQGTTVPGQFGPRLGKKEVTNNSKRIRELLTINDTALKTDGKADIADERYKEASIYYTLWDVNDEEKGEKILNQYLEIYKRYKELTMVKNVGKVTVVRQMKEFSIAPKYIPYTTALRTKPFMLLAGISGTGKSRIVREMAKSCWKPEDDEYWKDKEKQIRNNHPRNFCMVQVKPNWHDSSELIGYVSRLNGEKFVVGPFLRFLAAALKEPEVPYFLCLDEMNLAPVEQYFAEYLSVIESRKLNKDGIIETDPIIPYEKTDAYKSLIDQLFDSPGERDAYKAEEVGKRLTIPQNLFVVGTVNMDETTFSFSRKVLDRAMTIEMNEVDLHGGLKKDSGNEIGYIGNSIIGDAAEGSDVYETNKELCDEVLAYLEKVNAILEGTPFKIAYRTRNEFLMYAVNRRKLAPDSQLWQTLDEMTSMKILSRIEGDSDRTQKVLERLNALVEEVIVAKMNNNTGLAPSHPVDTGLVPSHPVDTGEAPVLRKSISAAKIEEMLGKLTSSSFTSYWT